MTTPAIKQDAPSPVQCVACDYDLRSTESDRCPECGLLLERHDGHISQIPWTYRKAMGFRKAFFRTIWLSLRQPSRLARDMAAPVNEREARRFQNIVVWFTSLSLFAGLLYCLYRELDYVYWNYWRRALDADDRWTITIECVAFVLFAICVGLFLKLTTNATAWLCGRRDMSAEHRARAVAIGRYACGPLIWTPVVLFNLHWLYYNPEAAVSRLGYDALRTPLLDILVVNLIILSGAWIYVSLRMVKCLSGILIHNTVSTAFQLMLAWTASAVVTLALLPSIFALILAIIYSYR